MTEEGDVDLTRLAFNIQLVDAYLFTADISRGPIEGTDELPSLHVETAVALNTETDSPGFVALLSAEVVIAIRENGQLTIKVTAAGQFASEKVHTEEFAATFVERDGVVLLWPFLRAYISQLASMTHLSVPPLPTLDVRAVRFGAERAATLDSIDPAHS